MRLALLLAAALGVHAEVHAPDMDPERKAEIAKKVREFQEMTRQNPALARPNTDAMYAALGKSRNCSHHILDIFADRFAKAHGLDDSEYDAMSGEAPGGKQEASPGTADYRGSGKNGLPTFDELQRGAAKEMAARQSLEDDDYLPNLKNEL